MSTQSMRMARTAAVSTTLFVCIAVLIAFAAFSGGLLQLVERWSRQEEYSHGFLIPFVVAWMLWSRRDAWLPASASHRGPARRHFRRGNHAYCRRVERILSAYCSSALWWRFWGLF